MVIFLDKKKVIVIILLIVFIGILSFSIYKIVNNKMETKKDNELQKEIINNVVIETIEEENKFINVDFTELLKLNNDTKGWISFNAYINHVFVQAADNDYYLRRNFRRQHSEYGTLFMDYRNNNFQDQNTVIFGHNSTGMNMFGSLKLLLNRKYFADEGADIIRISTLTNNYNFQIFSVYVIEMEEYYITPSFSDIEFKKFVDIIQRRSNHKLDVEVTKEDKILTLSTCNGFRGTTKRTVVHAKLIDMMER